MLRVVVFQHVFLTLHVHVLLSANRNLRQVHFYLAAQVEKCTQPNVKLPVAKYTRSIAFVKADGGLMALYNFVQIFCDECYDVLFFHVSIKPSK